LIADAEPYLYTQDKVEFLLNIPSIENFASILMEIQSKYEPDFPKRPHEERYKNIRECLMTHSNHLDNFEQITVDFRDQLQRAKTFLFETSWAKILHIDNKNDLDNIEFQFKKIMGALEAEAIKAHNLIKKIKTLDEELLYCFFNYETWGSTWCSELYISRQFYQTHTKNEIVEKAKVRLLNIQRANHISLAQDMWSDYQQEQYRQLDEEEYNNYDYTDDDWFIINTRICHEIHRYFKEFIERLRDSSRRVLIEINKIREEINTLNDPLFMKITHKMNNIFMENDNYKIILSQRNIKELYNIILRLLYDYKKEVEESEWRSTFKFSNERSFKRHLTNYLTRTRKEKIFITNESEKVRGKVDILINNKIVLELKLLKEPINMSELTKFIPQLCEVMENWQSKLGFLIVLDISKQEKSLASRENYFEATIRKGGMGLESEKDEFPVGVINLLVFGGERKQPSLVSSV